MIVGAPDEEFNELRARLDHIGFGCANGAELENWVSRLGELGIENGAIVDAPYGSGLSFATLTVLPWSSSHHPGDLANQRCVAKNARRSSTNNSGCSNAAKCPPRGMSVQWVML